VGACFQGGNSILRALKWYKNLESGSFRSEEGYFIVEGIRAVRQVLSTAPQAVDEIVVTDEYQKDIASAGVSIRKITSSQMDTISTRKNSQGIIAVVKIPGESTDDSIPLQPGTRVLLLEHIQDPGNVGTLLRSAAAFDFSGVILSTMSADPFAPKAVQASAGSLLSLWIRRTSQYLKLVEQLRCNGFQIAAMSTKGSEGSFGKDGKIVVALGNEGNGLSEDVLTIADIHCRIAINDSKVESLNVAVTGAIVMHAAISSK
jgi:TrmH family RNA methyltransferase